MLEEPSLLLVAQPEDSLPGVMGEIEVIWRALKARVKVTSLVSRIYTVFGHRGPPRQSICPLRMPRSAGNRKAV